MTDRIIFALFGNKVDAETAIIEMGLLDIRARDISIAFKSKEEKKIPRTQTTLSGLTISASFKGAGKLFIGGPLAKNLGVTAAKVSSAIFGGEEVGIRAREFGEGMKEMGMPSKGALVFQREILEGSVLLGIPSDDERSQRVIDILEELNGYNLHTIFQEKPKSPEVDYYKFSGNGPSGGKPVYLTIGTKGGKKKKVKAKKKKTKKE